MDSESTFQTINIDEDKLKKLLAISSSDGITINKLINNILNEYLIYGRFAEKSNVMHFRAPFIRSVFNQIPEETIIEIAKKDGIERTTNMMEKLGLPITMDNLIILLKEFLSKRSNLFKVNIDRRNTILEVNIYHGIDKKWSLYNCQYIITMFSLVDLVKINSKIDDYSATINFKIPTYK